MKKIFVFVSLLVLASLVLSACGAPTEAPVVATEPPLPLNPRCPPGPPPKALW
jgi:hypothetical protein